MKDDFARDIVDFLRNYWKAMLFTTVIGGAAFTIIKAAQPQKTEKPKQSSISADSLTDSLFKVWFKPIEPETLGLEFFIFKDAPEYENLEAITKDYPKAKDYIALVQKAVKDCKNIFPMDAVLVLGKIKAESEFERFAVSWVGAAGPSQLMPQTAKGYGLKVYDPDYLKRAENLNKEAIRLYRRAISLFTSKEFELAKATYLDYEKKRKTSDSLFAYYKKDLLSKVKGQSDSVIAKIDQRFILEKAVPAGVNYYALMFRKFKGDVRMGVSAYNCGPAPVSKAEGVPNIGQTIYYQNGVVNFHKRYHEICLKKPIQKNPFLFQP